MKINRQRWYDRLGYKPRLAQRLLDEASDQGKRYLAFFAYPRAGKSYGAAKHLGPYLLLPDFHAWIVAPTYLLGSKEFGYVYQDYNELGLLKEASRLHYDVRGGNMIIEFPWGAFLQVISADNPTALRAEELDFLILAEASALKPEIFERHLYARVEKRKGKILIPTTPKGYNWVYESFRIPSLKYLDKTGEYGPWKDGQREIIGGVENPKYDSAYWSAVVSAVPDYGDILETGVYEADTIERGRRTMAPEIFREQFGGDFSSYAGLIYHFEPHKHECEPFPIPDEWTHIIGYDHGANDPTAILFGSYGPDGTLYWWGEIYTKGLSAGEYASLIRRVLGFKRHSALVIDPSAKQVRIELSRVGLATTIPDDRMVEARITRLTQLMREGKMKVLKGTCPNLVRQFYAWEWDEEKPGKPRDGQEEHALDAAGYAVLVPVGLPGQGESDPDIVLGESPQVERVWKGVRKYWREKEEEKQKEEDEYALYGDVFEEDPINAGGHTLDHVF